MIFKLVVKVLSRELLVTSTDPGRLFSFTEPYSDLLNLGSLSRDLMTILVITFHTKVDS